MITLSSGDLQVVINPDFGAEICRLTWRGCHELLWFRESSVPIPAQQSMSYGSTFLDWLSHYRGGWQGLMPNIGQDSTALGIPIPFHGDTSTSTWDVIEVTESRVVMEVAGRLPIRMRRTVEVDGAVLRVHEEIRNLSGGAVPFIWGHHPAWHVEANTAVDLPAGELTTHAVSDYDPELNDLEPGSEARWPCSVGKSGEMIDVSVLDGSPVERQITVRGLRQGWAALRWEHRGIGAALSWDINTFPHVWMWTEIGGTGFPWYGTAKIVAVEPMSVSSGDGLAAARTRGEAFELEANGSRSTTLSVSVFATSGRPVRDVSAQGLVSFGDQSTVSRLTT